MKLNFLLIFLLISCTNTRINGHYFNNENLETLNSNATNKQEVLAILGSPTFISEQDDNIWYYVSRTVKIGPLSEPKLHKQKILKITFDEDGNISNIDDKIDGPRKFILNSNTTYTYGKGESASTHFIKNLGRFTKIREKKR